MSSVIVADVGEFGEFDKDYQTRTTLELNEIISYSDDQNHGWVDTVGWDDEIQDDTETFQGILRFLNRHNLTRVKAILWTVHPGTIRQDATLNKQAKLINLFADKDIWDNVIIICNFNSELVEVFDFIGVLL